jgi:uncharacterized DUF497 family protein
VPTVIDGDFEWDDVKAAANVVKHGVSFEEAASAFADPSAIIVDDGSGDGSFKLIGLSVKTRLLVVVHVERGARECIISARLATSAEEDIYLNG